MQDGMTRRSVLKGVGTAGLLAASGSGLMAWLEACSSSTPTTTPTLSTQPNLNLALPSLAPQVLDPSQAGAISGKQWWELTYDYLIGATPDGQRSKTLGVAQDWSSAPAGSGTAYTFKIRQGVKFHNGDPLTSADVKFSLEYMSRAGSLATSAAALRDNVKSIATPDPYTVVVTTSKPFDIIYGLLSGGGRTEGFIFPSKYVTEKGSAYFNANPIGSGPYEVASNQVGTGINYKASANPHFARKPRFKTLSLLQIPEDVSRLASLQTGHADIASITRLQASSLGSGLTLVTQKGADMVNVYFFNTWKTNTFLSNPSVRKALNLAIDRAAIKKSIFGGRAAVSGSSLYGTWALEYQAIPAYAYDPTQAKSLLKAAFPSGITLTMLEWARPGVPELPQVGQAVASMWRDLGVVINERPIDFGSGQTLWTTSATDNMTVAHYVGNGPTVDTIYTPLFNSGSRFALVKDPRMDQLLAGLTAESDLSKFAQQQRSIASFVKDNDYVAPIGEVDELFASRKEIVGSWNPGRIGASYNLLGLTTTQR